jgi:epoxide hydrolase 4
MKELVTKSIVIPTNGVRLHAETAGPADGRLVLLLHGFPENWACWQNQISPLAEAGYYVVAPDLRGYNLSDKPRGIAAYQTGEIARDVTGMIAYLGREKAIVVGHDWGAAVAWHVAIHFPERVEQLAILNVGHPAAMARALTRFTRQVLRSWYIYFFQAPALPEFLLRMGHYAPMRRMLRASSKPGSFSKEDLQYYTEAWAQPGALTAMINWYRAAVRETTSQSRKGYLHSSNARVHTPTLILWGERDVALIPELAEWSLEWCDQGELIRFPNATHWVQHDEAERVTNHLLGFLGNHR